MPKTQLAARIDSDIKKAVDAICTEQGWKINRFIEEALLDKMEELEDLDDLKSIRHEPTRPFKEVLAELKLHGKL